EPCAAEEHLAGGTPLGRTRDARARPHRRDLPRALRALPHGCHRARHLRALLPRPASCSARGPRIATELRQGRGHAVARAIGLALVRCLPPGDRTRTFRHVMASLAFPDGFVWGTATAAHQVEGGNWNNDWWAWEHMAGSPCVEPSADACDHYHRYPEDVRLLA